MLQQRPKDQAQPPTAAAPPNDDVGVVVAFLCLGSLGDVLPLLAVARRLAASSSHQYRPHLITHALYHDRLAPFLQQTTPEAIGFTGLPFPPMPPPDAGADHIDMELEACLAVCSSALERPDSNTALLLCANLVGKFAYHMAEILGVPFLLLAPSIPPPGPVPSLFTIRSLVGVEGEEGEALMRRLRRQTDGEKGEEESDEGSEVLRYRRRRVGMAELQHWMAALLLPPYRAFCRRCVLLLARLDCRCGGKRMDGDGGGREHTILSTQMNQSH